MVPDALTGGPHFAAYCERYIRHTKGRWAGRPLVYEPWQQEFWWEALEFDPATGLRIYESAHRIEQAFGADRYARLRAVKRRCDPDNRFRFNANIAPA